MKFIGFWQIYVDMLIVPSGKLTQLWKTTSFTGKSSINGPFSIFYSYLKLPEGKTKTWDFDGFLGSLGILKSYKKHAVTIIGKNSSILHSVASPNSTWNISEHFPLGRPFFCFRSQGHFPHPNHPKSSRMTMTQCFLSHGDDWGSPCDLRYFQLIWT